MRKTTIISTLFFVSFLCAEDAYHTALKNQLETEFGITGGDWVLRDTETTVISTASTTGLSKKTIDNDGSEPFTKIMELNIPTAKSNTWDNAARFNTISDIDEGDALLLVMWTRALELNPEYSQYTHIFEISGDPYTKSLSLGQKPALNEWQQIMLPFNAALDMEADNARYQINLGHFEGILQVAGIAVINYGDKYHIQDLPQTKYHLTYDGMEEGAQWRIDALERINQIRKGDITIKVVNKNDEPIQNAQVDLNMWRHEFGFGTAINMGRFINNRPDDAIYQEKLEDLTGDGKFFNIAVFENGLKWPPWEDDNSLGTKDQAAEVVDWLHSTGMKVRGHNLVWPKYRYMPDDIEENQNDPDYVRQRVYDRIFEACQYDGIWGRIDEWDVINEMAHCTDLADVFGTEDIYTDWLNWAHEADPNAILYLNEYSIINGGGQDQTSQQKFHSILQKVIDDGAPLGGIGIQGHFGSPLTPPEKVLSILDSYGVYEKDISITEYDASGVDPEMAANYMRDILITCFSHPAVKNFLMWGFWDGAHWHEDAPIFNKDWTLKPSGEAFIEWVFEKWWTNESGSTNRDGLLTINAFYGDYEIDIEFDGKQEYKDISFNKTTNTIEIKIDTEQTSVNDTHKPYNYQLYKNFPNPFNPLTTIKYSLKENTHVSLNVFNEKGQLIKNLVNDYQNAGLQTISFDGSQLPSGLYFYRLETANFKQTNKMLLIK